MHYYNHKYNVLSVLLIVSALFFGCKITPSECNLFCAQHKKHQKKLVFFSVYSFRNNTMDSTILYLV